MKGIAAAIILSFILISNAYAEIKLANGDQFGPAMDDFMNSLSDNEQRALEVGTRRLGLTPDEVKVLISSLRNGSKFSSVDQVNQIFKSNDGDNTTSNYINNNDYSQDKAKQAAKDEQQNAAIGEKVDKNEYAQDKTDQIAKDDQQNAAIGGKVDKNEYAQDKTDQIAKDDHQSAAIGGKVDKNEYAQDQTDQIAKDEQQNAAIGGKVDKNEYAQDKTNQIAKDDQQNVAIGGKVDKSDFLSEKNKQESALKAEVANRESVDSQHDKTLTEHDRLINAAQSSTDDANNKIAKNINKINQLDDEKANKETVVKAQKRADDAWHYADENQIALQKERDLRAEGDSRTLNAANKYTDSKFGQLSDEINSNRKKASAGIAGVAAMANIPQVSQNSTFSVGVGVGHYDNEQAMALGVSSRIKGNIVTKTSFSKSSQHELVFGAGASYEW